MAYTDRNFRTKKELREAVASGARITIFQPGGMFPVKQNGTVTIEGPHYPEPHRWYAEAVVQDGVIVRVK